LRGSTHFSFGLAIGVAVAGFTGENQIVPITITAAGAGLAALLPDLDEEKSLINSYLFGKIKKKNRKIALFVLGLLLSFVYGYFSLPFWVLLTGIFFSAVAFSPHRSVTHSLLGLGWVIWIMSLALPEYTVAVAMGYASHLFTDALTVSGIPLFWPWRKKITLYGLGIPIRTGEVVDHAIGRISLLLASAGYLYLVGKIIV
jgi:membrane-bound metal-dependent hydrolase YbcI (DUF457 family)